MMNRIVKLTLNVCLTFCLISSGADAISLTLEEVRLHIEQNDLDWVAGETSISKLSDEEFNQLLGLKLPDDYIEPPEIPGLNPNPFGDRAEWDWRDHNGVTAVKNQGGCGSCWAFATTGMVESFVKIYDGLDWDLSEQQLVSCNDYGYGCDGGWLYPDHYISPGGIYESCMPYQASDSVPCTENQCQKVAFIDDWAEINSSVTSIKNALVDGPVAVAMYVRNDFSYYSGGCYSGGSSSSVNHGVVIVGYNDSECSGQGAWYVKNSWGPNWGDDGFFTIKYGDSNIGYGATRIYYTSQGTVDLNYASFVVDDSTGNSNGTVDPGESVYLKITLGNAGDQLATGVAATLSCTNGLVQVNDGFASYPDIPATQQKQSIQPHYSIAVNPQIAGGTLLTFNLTITSNQGSGNDTFTLQMGSSTMPTWTPNAPTNTPIPSWTPIPTSTPVSPTTTPDPEDTPPPPIPTHTPGGNATSTPVPTMTPDPPGSPTERPTSTPDNHDARISLKLNQKVFRANTPFELKLVVDNPNQSFLSEQYIALQVGNAFFFWPSWTAELDRGLGIYDTGRTEKTILAFAWPDGNVQLEGLYFYAVLCNPGTMQTISNLASIEFGCL